MISSKKLSPLQLELLKIYSFNPEEEDLLAIKRMLGLYFAKKLRDKVDAAILDKNISSEDIDK